jgi:hypothetical protein
MASGVGYVSAGDWWIVGLFALPVAFFALCASGHWADSYAHQRNGDNGRAVGCIVRAWQHAIITFALGFCAVMLIVT